MAVFSIIGSKFRIGDAVTTKTVDWVTGDFTTPLTAATEVKEPETLGTIGDAWAELEANNVTEGRTKVTKGMAKAKPVEMTFNADYADAGQLAIRAAYKAKTNYAFELELADAPSGGTNSKRQFIGQVMMADDVVEAGNHQFKVSIQPNSNIVAVHAAPA